MVKRGAPSRGEVWLAALDPTVGREIRKTRPCMVVSPDSMNRFLGTATVLPLTSGSSPAAFRVPLLFQEEGGLLLCDQMRTLDRSRLVKRLGSVDEPTILRVLSVLREMFAE